MLTTPYFAAAIWVLKSRNEGNESARVDVLLLRNTPRAIDDRADHIDKLEPVSGLHSIEGAVEKI